MVRLKLCLGSRNWLSRGALRARPNREEVACLKVFRPRKTVLIKVVSVRLAFPFVCYFLLSTSITLLLSIALV